MSQLCQHTFEHNRMEQKLSIVTASIILSIIGLTFKKSSKAKCIARQFEKHNMLSLCTGENHILTVKTGDAPAPEAPASAMNYAKSIIGTHGRCIW